jgi:hypothetical protein
MARKVSTIKIICFLFIFSLLFTTAASVVCAYDWIVILPVDSEYSKCEITARGSGGDSGTFTIKQGKPYTWQARYGDKKISYIDGRCETPNWGAYKTEIQGRTCTGIDYQTSSPGGISCPNNVRVIICKKGDGVGAWSHGFCSE